jgi:hypothetical protein
VPAHLTGWPRDKDSKDTKDRKDNQFVPGSAWASPSRPLLPAHRRHIVNSKPARSSC